MYAHMVVAMVEEMGGMKPKAFSYDFRLQVKPSTTPEEI
jgi:hypothetical protein